MLVNHQTGCFQALEILLDKSGLRQAMGVQRNVNVSLKTFFPVPVCFAMAHQNKAGTRRFFTDNCTKIKGMRIQLRVQFRCTLANRRLPTWIT